MSISLFLVDERDLEYPSSPPHWGGGADTVLHLLYESAAPNRGDAADRPSRHLDCLRQPRAGSPGRWSPTLDGMLGHAET
jgi:hypothetical protein